MTLEVTLKINFFIFILMEPSGHIIEYLRKVALGDSGYFEKLFRLYKDKVYSIALTVMKYVRS